MDVTSEAALKAAIDDVAAHFGSVDVLVNNAGVAGANRPTHEITEAEWDWVQAVNVKGVFFATKHAIPHMKRAGRVWIRIFPDVPVSKKPAEVRMGSGKGAPEFWVAKIKPGRILFEIDGVDLDTAKEAMRLGAAKLSIATKFIQRTL